MEIDAPIKVSFGTHVKGAYDLQRMNMISL